MKRFFITLTALGMIMISVACSPAEKPDTETASETSTEALLETTTETATEAASETITETVPETVTFKAEDNLTITADLYKTNKEDAPYIILYHQAGSSRGEYISIAPKLNKMGFNCLTVDQRSGNIRNEIVNKTAEEANSLGLENGYADAWPDVTAAFLYVRDELKAEKIILWGSSYSASLSVIMGSKYPEDIAGILAFSPGEYFEFENNTVAYYAADIECPVFITSEENETYAEMAKALYGSITADGKVFYLPDGVSGVHGSSVLADDHSQNGLYWAQVTSFLNMFTAHSSAVKEFRNLSGREITDLTQAGISKDVTILYLHDNKISDLRPLTNLPNLNFLEVSSNEISDISPLKDMPNLKQVNLDNNKISDLSPLKDMTNLTYLRLDGNQITDLSPLENLTNLTELHLFNNQISDLSPLKNLTNLRILYLDSNQISDISPLKDLTNLAVLDLSDNQVSDWLPVSHLTNVGGRP